MWSVVVSQSYRPIRYVVAAGVSAVVAIEAPYWTVSVPVMFGCTLQEKAYVPAFSAGIG